MTSLFIYIFVNSMSSNFSLEQKNPHISEDFSMDVLQLNLD